MLAALVVVLRSLALICGGHRAVALENLALRQQLAVFKRTADRPQLRHRDRRFWMLVAQAWRHESSNRSGMGHGSSPGGHQAAPRLVDPSGSLCGGLAHRRGATCCGATSRASSKRRGCWRCCARAIPSNFTLGQAGPCNGGFATGGRGTTSSPRCSSSKSPLSSAIVAAGHNRGSH